MDVVARWPVPVPWPLSSERWALYLIAQDFSLTIDIVLVVGLLATLYDPLQPRARPIALGTAALVTVWLAAGLPT